MSKNNILIVDDDENIAELISLTVSLIFFIRINKTIISKIPDGSDIL